jgi:dTDP-4-dehydrorhamnose reductase
MKILATGLTGLVGSRFTDFFENIHEIENINLENRINILDTQEIEKVITSSDAEIVLHMAAKTNVDGCEEDMAKDKEILAMEDVSFREKAWKELQSAYAVNVFGTQNIVNACKKANKKIVYISTDFVFNGQKKSYSEEDEPEPINWYAKTKYEGEKLITNSGLDYIIVRIAYPYRAFFKRGDFVRGLINKLEKKEKLEMITDHIMVPTFIDDIVNAIDALIQQNQNGIFHVVGSQTITPYQAAIKIAQEFNLDETLISKTTRVKYFAGKAQRPFCLNLKNDKINNLGIEMSSFDMGIRQVKNQIDKLKI